MVQPTKLEQALNHKRTPANTHLIDRLIIEEILDVKRKFEASQQRETILEFPTIAPEKADVVLDPVVIPQKGRSWRGTVKPGPEGVASYDSEPDGLELE